VLSLCRLSRVFAVLVAVCVPPLMGASHAVTIVCHGHSVPAGYFKSPARDDAHAYPHLLAAYLPGARVIVTARPSETSEQGAARFSEVLTLRPDIVTIDYALNDRAIGLQRAEAAWRKMIEAAQAQGARVILLTPTPDTRRANPQTGGGVSRRPNRQCRSF
jgi:acyl-CoA thioesterase-1